MILSNIIKIFKILFCLCLVYFAFLLLRYHFYLTIFPYPNNYREGAMMATTTMLLHGVKPYNFLLEPQYTNIYGIVYPLIVFPFAKLFGTTLVVHRGITAFFILASCLVIFLVLHQRKTPLLLNFWAILTLYASLLFPLTSTPCVDPASTGLFFMLLTIFIPFFFNYSYLSLSVSLICGILAFYTKPYFILGLPIIISYLFFFISKKKSLFFGFCCAACFLLTTIITNYFLPSYFDDCFFIHNNYAREFSSTSVLENQLFKFLNFNKGIFLLMLLVFLYNLYRCLTVEKIGSIKEILKACLTSIRLLDWDEPLFVNLLPVDIYAGIFFAIVLVSFLGKHSGANLWYFFQLFTPFLVIFVASVTGRFKFWPLVLSFLLIYNLFSLTSDDDYQYFDKNLSGWSPVEEFVKSNAKIYNSSLIAPLLIKENKEVYDDGQTEYFAGGGRRKGFWSLFFKEDKKVLITNGVFMNKLDNMIKDKEFDLLIIEAGYYSDIMPDNIKKYYNIDNTVMVFEPQDRKPNLITIWRPN